MNTVSSPSSKRARAVNLLEQIRTSISGGKLDEAAQQAAGLQELLGEWSHSISEEVSAALAWLDTALETDLLMFNVDAANKYLSQWQAAVVEDDNPELAQYRAKVQERARQKQTRLQTRGVTAHCEELWAKARELERSDQPAHPDFLLTNYYTRARDVAEAARTDDQENPDLDVLLQKAERLRASKVSANRVYRNALEEERYTDALSELAKLPAGELVPRYRTDQSNTERLTFDGMVSIAEARSELEAQAREWAAKKGRDAARQAEELLGGYQPQAALDLVGERQPYDQFLADAMRKQLQQVEERARNEAQLLQHAERRVQQALTTIEEDPLSAWEIYVEAQTIYRGAPSLESAHTAILAALNRQLKQRIAEAELAFGRKQMDEVQQLYQKAQQGYGGKDSSLDEQLHRLADMEWQARTYQDYLQNAIATLTQIKDMMSSDVPSASELLQQLEGYPEIVLEEFGELPQVRAEVEKLEEVERTYARLYDLLYSDSQGEVEAGIAESREHPEQTRFEQLGHALEIHAMFLNAQQRQSAGEMEQARALLTTVASAEGHPDQGAAQRLLVELPGQSSEESEQS